MASVSPDDLKFWQAQCALRDARPAPTWSAAEREELAAFNRKVGMKESSLFAIDQLGQKETLCVVAGQQCGLFLTPLYILYKALGAIKWSQALSELLGRPVLPVFWIASEDHDIDEIRRTVWLNQAGEPQQWEWDYPPEKKGAAVAKFPADPGQWLDFLNRLDEDFRDTEFKADFLGKWRQAVQAAETVEDFFGRLMAECLGDTGLILLPSGLQSLRERSRPLFARELAQPGCGSEALIKAAQQWESEGREAPIHRRPEDFNGFLFQDGRRCRLRWEGQDFALLPPFQGEAEGRLSREALEKMLAENPERFSPNVATRPLVQDSALPTLAQVGGPGEIAYLSFLREAGFYEIFEVFPAVLLDRPRFCLLEPPIARKLSRYEIPPDWVAREDKALLQESILQSQREKAALEAWERAMETIDGAWKELPKNLGRLAEKPELASGLKKTEKSLRQSAEKFRDRLVRALREEDGQRQKDWQQISNSLFPLDSPQERVLGPAHFRLRYGAGWIKRLAREMKLDHKEVQILELGKGSEEEDA